MTCNKRFIKIISLLLVLLAAAVPLLSSCSGSGGGEGNLPGGETTGTAAAETTTEKPLYPEYELDLEGADFNMIYYDAVEACGWSSEIPCDIDVDEQTGDILADAIYLRNSKIGEMYNTNIVGIQYAKWDLQVYVAKSVLAGDSAYDAMFPNWQIMNGVISQGLAVRLDGLFDMSMPWWDEKAEEAFKVAGKTYAACGDLTFMDKLCDIVIFFNKQMVEDYNIGDIYKLVVDGKWTFDKLIELSELVSADLNNDGKYDRNDRYGFSAQNDGFYELYNSAGERFCAIGDDGIPYLSATGERAISVMTDIYTFMNRVEHYFNRQTQGLTVGECIEMFRANQALFFMRPLQTVMELRSMDADFGIIPTPKYDEAQESYYTSIGFTVAIATCIPSDVKSIDNSVAVLDTLAAESYYNVNEVLYDMVLGSKVTRDENSTENLDIIFNNHLLDPGEIFQFGGFANGMMANWKGAADKVVSTIAGYESKINADIEKFLETLESLE